MNNAFLYLLAGVCLLMTSSCGRHSQKVHAKEREKIALYKQSMPEPFLVSIANVGKFKEKEMQEFLQAFICRGDLVFDVGANVGKKTELYLACGARVVDFEPQPQCIKTLEEKFKDNAQVVIEPMGLGESESTEELFICTAAPTISTFSQDYIKNSRFSDHGYEWDEKVSICLTTLDKMIEKYGLPRFCKIDVENFEFQVLKGLTQPLPCLSFECNTDQWETTKKCLAYLTTLGYHEFNFAIGERGLFISSHWLSTDELLEKIEGLMAKHDFSSIWGLWGDVYARYQGQAH